jgi:gamma-glutamyltranspeptidase
LSFYEGCLAEDIARDVKRAKGIIMQDDLKDYKPVWKEALKSSLSDLDFFTTAPPSSGAVITLILNILKGNANVIGSSMLGLVTIVLLIKLCCHYVSI